MTGAIRIGAQVLLYGALMVLVGTLSSYPRFRLAGDDQALVRVSIVHAAQRKLPCRERTAAELAKLAPNMRAAQECPRERADLLVEIELDGQVAMRRTVAPSGFQRDGRAALYQRFAMPAGAHRVVARLRDRPDGGFNHVKEATLDLKPGAALVIDFSEEKGGFLFRS